MGRVQELITSRDGQARSAKVLIPSNGTVGRPLNLLYLVECQVTNTDESSEENNSTAQNDDASELPDKTQQTGGRPTRRAASEAMRKISEQLNDNFTN